MTDTERIKRLALWMRWTIEPPNIDSPYGWYKGHPTEADVGDWNPITRIQDEWMLEDKIFERGLETIYMYCLLKVVHGNSITNFKELTVRGLWFLIHATPEQRCTAIEKLIEAKS